MTTFVFFNNKYKHEERSKWFLKFPYNIELITPIDGAFLEYEKQSEDFKVLEI